MRKYKKDIRNNRLKIPETFNNVSYNNDSTCIILK